MAPSPPDLEDVRVAHRRLRDLIAGLDDATARRPSLLPGWTVGHVLTHLARNADSFTWLCKGSQVGEVRDQYPGGVEQRAADIERGANRSAAELVADVWTACARLEASFEATTDWTAPVRTTAEVVPVGDLPFRRLREVEMHMSDLGFEGVTWARWSAALVNGELDHLDLDQRRHLVAFLAGRADPPPGLFG